MIASHASPSGPTVLTRGKTSPPTGRGELVFQPTIVQAGQGPHLHNFAYACDVNWDPFHSNLAVTGEGVKISNTEGRSRSGINVRWKVEGYGYLYMTADNGSAGYELPPAGKTATLSLNY